MKRSPLPPRKTPLTRTPLNPVSPKRRSQNREYHRLRAVFLAAHPACETCGKPATDVHPRRGRGSLLLVVEHWSALCRSCHHHWTVNPAAAYEAGISERRVA